MAKSLCETTLNNEKKKKQGLNVKFFFFHFFRLVQWLHSCIPQLKRVDILTFLVIENVVGVWKLFAWEQGKVDRSLMNGLNNI